MTALTPAENYAVASEILAEVSLAIGEGARPEVVERDIARAQVYATLATVLAQPTQNAIQNAIVGALEAQGWYPGIEVAEAAAEAVGRLL